MTSQREIKSEKRCILHLVGTERRKSTELWKANTRAKEFA